MTPEGKIKAKVKKALEGMGYVFMPVQRGLGASALDYYCCYRGMFVAIETKVPKKKLTARQVVVAKQIADAHGAVFVVRDADDISEMTTILGMRVQGIIYDRLGSTDMYGSFWWHRL